MQIDAIQIAENPLMAGLIDEQYLGKRIPVYKGEEIMRRYGDIQNYYSKTLAPMGIYPKRIFNNNGTSTSNVAIIYKIANDVARLNPDEAIEKIIQMTGIHEDKAAVAVNAIRTGRKQQFIEGKTLDKNQRKQSLKLKNK